MTPMTHVDALLSDSCTLWNVSVTVLGLMFYQMYACIRDGRMCHVTAVLPPCVTLAYYSLPGVLTSALYCWLVLLLTASL